MANWTSKKNAVWYYMRTTFSGTIVAIVWFSYPISTTAEVAGGISNGEQMPDELLRLSFSRGQTDEERRVLFCMDGLTVNGSTHLQGQSVSYTTNNWKAV